jgi:hypothetical protein
MSNRTDFLISAGILLVVIAVAVLTASPDSHPIKVGP